LVFRSGHWYLVGLDREREEIRAFRLSRAGGELRLDGKAGQPPEGFRAAEHVSGGPFGPGEAEERATVAFSPDVAWWATRGVQGAVIEETWRDGWVQVSLPAAPGDALASWILSFGPDAVAVAPEALRAEIVHRLEAALR
jgi:proteasome accessory factor B